jgi:hypothetical protein
VIRRVHLREHVSHNPNLERKVQEGKKLMSLSQL